MIILRACFATLGVLVAASAQSPSDSEIRKLLSDRVDKDHKAVGMVAGLIDGNGRRIIAYGRMEKSDSRAPDGNTVFEIGSVSKVFTSLILMDMVERGEVAVTDPISKFLPSSVKVPERNGKQITLADLSTQTSGLPPLPTNLKFTNMSNPYADYTVEQLYQFLSGYQLTRDIGEKYEYSNLGVGLLGHVLALRAGMSYEEMVRSRICTPLHLEDTRITLTPDMKLRFASGYNAALSPASHWDFPTLPGAGALRSTANDMLTFLAANLGYTKTPLASAMAREISVRKATGMPGVDISYGWHVITRDGHSIIWHNGGTGGFRTFVGFNPETRVGVVVLANAFTAEGPDDIGRHLLDASYKVLTFAPPQERKQIAVDTKIFDGYVGRYQMAPDFILSITREGDHFYAQATGQGRFEIFPEGAKEYFAKAADIQFSFTVGEAGQATQLVVHQNGVNTVSKRVE